MGRPKRAAQGNYVYHVLKHANARMTIFEQDDDYEAFLRVLEEAVERTNTRLLAYCVMPEQWHWGSLHRWKYGAAQEKSLLAAWPLARLPRWVDHVNAAQTESELKALRRSVQRGTPFGGEDWTATTVQQLGLESTMRSRGRPKKHETGS